MSSTTTTTSAPVSAKTNRVHLNFFGTASYYNKEKQTWTFNISQSTFNKQDELLQEVEAFKVKKFNLNGVKFARPIYHHTEKDAYTISARVALKENRSEDTYTVGKTYVVNSRCNWYEYEVPETQEWKYGWWVAILGARETDKPMIGELWEPEQNFIADEDLVMPEDDDTPVATSSKRKAEAAPAKSGSKKEKAAKVDPKQTKLDSKKTKKVKKEADADYVPDTDEE